jgi:hypothetical protein
VTLALALAAVAGTALSAGPEFPPISLGWALLAIAPIAVAVQAWATRSGMRSTLLLGCGFQLAVFAYAPTAYAPSQPAESAIAILLFACFAGGAPAFALTYLLVAQTERGRARKQ